MEADIEALVPSLAVVGEPVIGIMDGNPPLLVKMEWAPQGDFLYFLVEYAPGGGQGEVVLFEQDAHIGDLACVIKV